MGVFNYEVHMAFYSLCVLCSFYLTKIDKKRKYEKNGHSTIKRELIKMLLERKMDWW